MEHLKLLLKGELKENYPLKNLSWFKVGGNAEYFFSPIDADDLLLFIKKKPKNLPIHIIGAGSNTLIRDKGFSGCIIKLNQLNKIDLVTKDTIYIESGCLNTSLVFFAKKHNITNFEFLSGIPGTIGGALAMNAGCFNLEMKDIVLSIKVYDIYTDKIINLDNKEINFHYRGNGLKEGMIFISTILKGCLSKLDEINKKLEHIKNQREHNQPKKVLTGGSTFANPNCNLKAWQLIDKVGLRGYKIGGASFSEKHCNFLLNDGTATSKDIEDLIALAKEKVSKEFNIILKEEIKIIGTK